MEIILWIFMEIQFPVLSVYFLHTYIAYFTAQQDCIKIKGLGTGECGKLSLVKIKLIALCIMRCWFFMKIL